MSISNLASETAQQLDVRANAVTATVVTAIASNFIDLQIETNGNYAATFAAIGDPIGITDRKGTITITAIGGGFASGASNVISLTGANIYAEDACLLAHGPYATVSTQSKELVLGVQSIVAGKVEIVVSNTAAGAYGATEFVIQYMLI